MRFANRRDARAAAESLIKSLNAKHLCSLGRALSNALVIYETLDHAALFEKSQETVGAAQEAHNSLLYWLAVCEGTISDLKASPISHSDGEVHAFGQTWTPAQACAVSKRLAQHAYHANTHVQRAVELARPVIEGKQIVTVQ